MKPDYPRFFTSVLISLILVWTLSCSGKSGSNVENMPAKEVIPEEERAVVKMVAPEENAEFKLGESIKVILSVDQKRLPDSIILSYDSKKVTVLKNEPWEYVIPSDYTGSTGRKALKASCFEKGRQTSAITKFMIVYANAAPPTYGYKVVHTYPHDRQAFTQGLFYYKGILYEGTGQETGSSLREVELETGKVLRQLNLDPSLFGEGITLYNDRIYQVTWENKVGFVYDRAAFRLINKIYYPTQGWGLTTLDDRIVMSDGTNVLYFYEPESFTVVSRLEVFDDRKQVDSLNELEYINGEIWANIWMTDLIARIDPETGKVNSYVNLRDLLKDSDKAADTDVLNGIAWDPEGKRLFVTGKRWPKLFEIRIDQ